MALIEKKRGNYLSIIDGTLRRQVPEGTEKAIKREYERSDKTKGEKWELEYRSLVGKIVAIDFHDSDFGKQVAVEVMDEGKKYTLQMPYKSRYALDFMKKVPNIKLADPVELSPYDFEDDNGKTRKGISIKQGEVKIGNYFFNEKDKRENLHDFPQAPKDYQDMDSDDWAVHFTNVAKFLMEHIQKEQKYAREDEPTSDKVEYPTDEINPEDIPF